LISLKKMPLIARLARHLHTHTHTHCFIGSSEKFSQNNIKNPDFDSVNQVPDFFMLFSVVLGKSSVSRMN